MEPPIKQQQETIAQFIDRINESTSLEVLERVKTEPIITRFEIIKRVFKATIRSLFIRKVYKRGIEGFVIGRLEGIAALVQSSKLWEYQMRSKGGTGFMPPTSVEDVQKIKQRYKNQ